MIRQSNILKAALFATGVAGIVAEYILSTLATYFLGDSVFQWTIIVSVMLFSMGLGSRLSRYISRDLLQNFIFIEFALSILTSFSAILVYYLAAFTVYTGFFIYTLAVAVGVLIGMEIPLVTRLNEQFEELKVNIASVLEKDYYGSLAGGLFFAFVGLPILGLTYTPFILGSINFLVAVFLFVQLRNLVVSSRRIWLALLAVLTGILLAAGAWFADPVIKFGEQARYRDKVVFSEQSRYQHIVMTQWKDNFWLYINGNSQLSTLDEFLYHEPLVHPAMMLARQRQNVLIMGGGDGCAAREVLKYARVDSVHLVDLDPVMTRLGQTHPVLTELNHGALNDPRVRIFNQDAYQFIESPPLVYDVIIIDLPDPKSVDLGRLYSREFYQLCGHVLRPGGMLVTQAGSPYYATAAFECIRLTMESSGFQTLPLHNQVLTMGEWGWILAGKGASPAEMKERLIRTPVPDIPLTWLNQEALSLITSFGKPLQTPLEVEVNTLINPVLYKVYLQGNWDVY